MTRLVLLVFVPALTYAQSPSAGELMRIVIQNQERSQSSRAAYVYDEKVFVRLQKPNGKPTREENRLYTILPKAQGVERSLMNVDGKVFDGKRTTPYTDPEFRRKGMDIDADLTGSFAGNIMWKQNQDMPLHDWFPLRSSRVADYEFEMKGEERYRDFDVYRIAFTGDDCWSGEALIEKNELQPVLVTTAFECKIPKAVTIMLGTNFSQAGAKITYQRVEPGVWFPATVGGELKLRILFFYARTIAFTAINSGFRKADVTSEISFESQVP